MFGLNNNDIKYILEVIEKYSEIEKAVIFGSRAKGNYKNGSDIDIAIFGEKITFDTISSLYSNLNDKGPLPYFIDIVDFSHLKHNELKDHIERKGCTIYKKNII